jgi:hypothetical protein
MVQDPASVLLQDIQDEIAYILTLQRTNGAFIDGPGSNMINPYRNNAAALSLLQGEKPELTAVARYLGWYFGHVNKGNRFSLLDLPGSIYDYIDDGSQTDRSTHNYDSVDSYVATFLSLCLHYAEKGGCAEILNQNRQSLNLLVGAMKGLLDRWLTWDKPHFWKIKYLMDNCEVFKGFKDAAALFRVYLNDKTAADRCNLDADKVREAIHGQLRKLDDSQYYWAKGMLPWPRSVNWKIWYPDSVSQIYPLLFQVDYPDHPIAVRLFEELHEQHQGWKEFNYALAHGEKFKAGTDTSVYPWCLVGYVSAIMDQVYQHDERVRENNIRRTRDFYINVKTDIVAKNHSPFRVNNSGVYWTIEESAWYIFMLSQIVQNGWTGTTAWSE